MKIPPSAPPIQARPGQAFDAPKIAKRSREDVDPQIREAAEGLEAMFLDTMMQAMRGTVQESEYSLENSATKIYRGMLDQEVSKQTARSNSVGLADQIVAYLEQRGYNGNQASVHGRTKPGAALPPSPPAPGKAPAEQKVGGAAGVAEEPGQ